MLQLGQVWVTTDYNVIIIKKISKDLIWYQYNNEVKYFKRNLAMFNQWIKDDLIKLKNEDELILFL